MNPTSESMEQSLSPNLLLNPIRQSSPSSIRAHLIQDMCQMLKTTSICLPTQHKHTDKTTLELSFAFIKTRWDVEFNFKTTTRAHCLLKWNDLKQIPACYQPCILQYIHHSVFALALIHTSMGVNTIVLCQKDYITYQNYLPLLFG